MPSWQHVNIYWGSIFGFFLGFAFGVGCALAVMYSIYMGGYRAAVRDSLLPAPPDRLTQARSQARAQLDPRAAGAAAPETTACTRPE